jgi:ferredoxin-like protein FixX
MDRRWLAVSAATFCNVPRITIADDLGKLTQQKLVEICPQHVFKRDTHSKLILANVFRCTTCYECLQLNVKNSAKVVVSIGDEPTSFLFSFDNKGVVRCGDIINFLIKTK